MELDIQIYSFIYSFFFGMIFYYLLDLVNKYIVKIKLIWKIILSFGFIFLISLGYFVGLLFINNGILHIYFIGSLLVGYFCSYFIFKRYLTLWKRK